VRQVHVSTGYTPRPLQAQLHRQLKRFNVLVCHRRFGKTVFTLNEKIDRALTCKLPMPRYAYVAPLYRQAKTVAWDYLKHYTSPIPGTTRNEAELRVDLPNGARIQLFGADNYDSLRGAYWDGVTLDEYAQMPPKAWTEVIRPALADRNGWATFIGTPKGRNAFCELYEGATLGFKTEAGRVMDPEWFGCMHRASETSLIPASELAAARRQMDPGEYEQEFECSFQAAIIGAYYGQIMATLEQGKKITSVPWDPALPVLTCWDIGFDDATAIWFMQIAGRECRLIEYYENSGVGFEHYAGELSKRPYVYSKHFLPHDVSQHEIGSGKSRADVLWNFGIRATVIPKVAIDDGIQAVRSLLPRCVIDVNKCALGIEALRQYQREWDEKRQVFQPRPRHDWASHAADALRYGALGLRPDEASEPMGEAVMGRRTYQAETEYYPEA
jgi:phage terminase large subunit